jgi:hypothetical protein
MVDYIFSLNSSNEAIKHIQDQGFAVLEDVFSNELMNNATVELESAIEKEAKFHGTTSFKDYAMLLACPLYGGIFIELLNNENLWIPFNDLLDPTCITYVYTSSSMPPKSSNYSKRIHVDRPHYNPNMLEFLGCLICVSDFNAENGGTWILPKSHKLDEKPTEKFFYENAIQIECKKGSVLYFNLRIWHAGGHNTTSKWRHALGIGMCKPYFKQRIDLPRAIPPSIAANFTELVKQKLGYNAQSPTSLNEFYAPLENRTYKEKSEWDK